MHDIQKCRHFTSVGDWDHNFASTKNLAKTIPGLGRDLGSSPIDHPTLPIDE